MQTEKEAQASENTAGSVRWAGGETCDPPRPPPLERKLSKRREVQEERTIVIDLFKELISKVNESTPLPTQSTPKYPHTPPPNPFPRPPKSPSLSLSPNPAKPRPRRVRR
jgi:hypothetical protein